MFFVSCKYGHCPVDLVTSVKHCIYKGISVAEFHVCWISVFMAEMTFELRISDIANALFPASLMDGGWPTLRSPLIWVPCHSERSRRTRVSFLR